MLKKSVINTKNIVNLMVDSETKQFLNIEDEIRKAQNHFDKHADEYFNPFVQKMLESGDVVETGSKPRVMVYLAGYSYREDFNAHGIFMKVCREYSVKDAKGEYHTAIFKLDFVWHGICVMSKSSNITYEKSLNDVAIVKGRHITSFTHPWNRYWAGVEPLGDFEIPGIKSGDSSVAVFKGLTCLNINRIYRLKNSEEFLRYCEDKAENNEYGLNCVKMAIGCSGVAQRFSMLVCMDNGYTVMTMADLNAIINSYFSKARHTHTINHSIMTYVGDKKVHHTYTVEKDSVGLGVDTSMMTDDEIINGVLGSNRVDLEVSVAEPTGKVVELVDTEGKRFTLPYVMKFKGTVGDGKARKLKKIKMNHIKDVFVKIKPNNSIDVEVHIVDGVEFGEIQYRVYEDKSRMSVLSPGKYLVTCGCWENKPVVNITLPVDIENHEVNVQQFGGF